MLEDDYDSEFRYDRQPVGALQGVAPDRVILLGSTSKTHAPAIRIGWIAAPGVLLPELAERKDAADRGSSALDQFAFGLLLGQRPARPARARHEVHLQATPRRARRSARRAGPLAAADRNRGGLPRPAATAERLRRRRCRSASGGALRRTPRAEWLLARSVRAPTLALGFGGTDEEQIEAGVRIIGELTR